MVTRAWRENKLGHSSSGYLTRIFLHPIIICGCLAVISVWRQGFHFAINNNVFHIPIVLGWMSLPQFHDDDPIQSLAYYISPIYYVLSAFLDESTILSGFLTMHVLTRLLTLAALYSLIGHFGLNGRGWRGLALLIIVLWTPSYGHTPHAYTGLFINYFTHSELAQAAALGCLGAVMAKRFDWAGLLAGITFLLNAFMGTWLVLPISVGALVLLGRHRPSWKTIKPMCIGAAIYAACVLPIAWWILQTPRDPIGFDYREYLLEYFPYHFFFRWHEISTHTRFGVLLAAALLFALLLLPREGRRAALFNLGILASIFVSGIVVGELASGRTLLNLQLLRVDGLLTLVALAILAAGLVRVVAAAQPLSSFMALAVVIAAMRPWGPELLAATSAALLLSTVIEKKSRSWRVGRLPPQAALITLLLVLALANWRFWMDPDRGPSTPLESPARDSELVGKAPARPEWAELKAWIAANTPVEARFLVPQLPVDFRIGTKRSAWVDWKQGASAMWAPATYHRWRQRFYEVESLHSIQDMVVYARRNGLSYVVVDKRKVELDPADAPIFENRWFAVLETPDTAELRY